MYKQGTLIAVNGNLYEYGGYDKEFKVHLVYEVEIDEDGNLTATYVERAFTDAEFSNRGINLTQKQWLGIVEYMLRNDYLWSKVLYNLTEEEIETAAEDIVYREFAILGVPTVEELNRRIECYMDR
jgi:hypothetical protein